MGRQKSKRKKLTMPSKSNKPILSFSGIPKNALHIILHNLLKQQVQSGFYNEPPAGPCGQTINNKQQTSSPQTIANGKRETRNCLPTPRHHFILFQYYKNYRLLTRLRSTALSLLKTQYAKKPKNPT
jgi:hypothetical protein